MCVYVCVCVLRTINAFLELSADRARADSRNVSVEITTCKNSSPNIIAMRASKTSSRSSLDTDRCQSHFREVSLNDTEKSKTWIYIST